MGRFPRATELGILFLGLTVGGSTFLAVGLARIPRSWSRGIRPISRTVHEAFPNANSTLSGKSRMSWLTTREAWGPLPHDTAWREFRAGGRLCPNVGGDGAGPGATTSQSGTVLV